MKKNIFIVMCILIMTLFSGCKEESRSNSEPVIIDTSLNATNYYFATSQNNASLLNRICSGYNYRMENGMAKSLSDLYFNEKMLVANLKSDFPEDDGFEKITEKKTLRLGFVNGKFAFEKNGEIDGYFGIIGGNSAMYAIRGTEIGIEKVIFENETEALKALKNSVVDCVVGISDNNDKDLLFSEPFCIDRFVLYSKNEIPDISAIKIFTTEEYKKYALDYTKSTDVDAKENVGECISEIQNSKKGTAAFVMLSDI